MGNGALHPPGPLGVQFARDANGNVTGFYGPDGSVKPLMRSGKLRNNVGAMSLQPGGLSGGTTAQNWHTTFSCNRAFSAIEVIVSSASAASGLYDKLAVAASKNITAPSTPTEAWNVLGSSIDCGLGGTANLPIYLSSGPIACRSVARNDGGRDPLGMVRFYIAGAPPGYKTLTNFSTQYDTLNPNNVLQTYSQSGIGDATSANQTNFTSTTRGNILMPAVIRPWYDTPGYTILDVGDSIIGGDSVVDGSCQRMSYSYLAVQAMQNSGMPIDLVNGGFSGNTWAQYSPRAKALMDLIAPDVVLIPAATPNDTYASQAVADLSWFNCMQLVNYALASGIVPIVVTPAPLGTSTALQDGYRLSIRTRALASGYACLDVEPIWSDGTSPAQWVAGLNDDFATAKEHPNHAGNAALAPSLVVLFKKIFY